VRERLRRWLQDAQSTKLPTRGLAGRRAVGAGAYTLAEEAESLRGAADWDPWLQPPQTQLFLLCAWNAFALQSIADHALPVDEVADEAIVAFAQACLVEVPTWIGAARALTADAHYRPTTALPAPLPVWPRLTAVTDDHTRVLRAATEALSPAAEYDATRLEQTAPADCGDLVRELRLQIEQLRTAQDFAAGLQAKAATAGELGEVRDELCRALQGAYRLGQLAAMPSLLEMLRPDDGDGAPLLTAIARGWAVEDASGAPVGRVEKIEGEPALGVVTGIRINTGAFSPDRRAAAAQIASARLGVVRLRVACDALQQA
jgi:hypothetical protein